MGEHPQTTLYPHVKQIRLAVYMICISPIVSMRQNAISSVISILVQMIKNAALNFCFAAEDKMLKGQCCKSMLAKFFVWYFLTHYPLWTAASSGSDIYPDSKVHGANMGPIWGWQDRGGPHVGPMNLSIICSVSQNILTCLLLSDAMVV